MLEYGAKAKLEEPTEELPELGSVYEGRQIFRVETLYQD